MIELKNIRKGYLTRDHGFHVVLDNVNLKVGQRDNIGVLGRNGAGKSTLMRVISGLDVPDSGEVIIGETRLSWPLGLPTGVHGSLTGKDNVKFISRVYGIPFDQVFDFVQSFADLGDYMDMPVRTYSSGMKSRLGFGISMAMDFDTYLIDEGFSAGDARFLKKTEEIFAEKMKKANIIVVAHQTNIIKKFCNKVAILRNGKLEIFDDVKEGIKVYKNL